MQSLESSYITPGALVSLSSIVYHLSSKGQLTVGIAHRLVSSSGLLGGQLPVSDGIKLGATIGVLEISSGNIKITDYCELHISPHCTSEKPTLSGLRSILLRVLMTKIPAWLAFFSDDQLLFRAAIPYQWIELLNQAELLDFNSDEVLDWWRRLLIRFNDVEQQRLKDIGDIGEKLTLEFEKERIVTEGVPIDLSLAVIWVSRISDAIGFDVKSIFGKRFQAKSSVLDTLRIEVKSSVIENTSSFRFKLSRNEWKVAEQNLDNYYFYCWAGIELKSQTSKSGPFVIPARKFAFHIPVNQGDICEWSECAFELNLADYSV